MNDCLIPDLISIVNDYIMPSKEECEWFKQMNNYQLKLIMSDSNLIFDNISFSKAFFIDRKHALLGHWDLCRYIPPQVFLCSLTSIQSAHDYWINKILPNKKALGLL